MKTFIDLKFVNSVFGNGSISRAKLFFPNGYGVSVIIGANTYGGSEGLYECAVLKGNARKWTICYDTIITNDVIGYCTIEKVNTIMRQIQEL